MRPLLWLALIAAIAVGCVDRAPPPATVATVDPIGDEVDARPPALSLPSTPASPSSMPSEPSVSEMGPPAPEDAAEPPSPPPSPTPSAAPSPTPGAGTAPIPVVQPPRTLRAANGTPRMLGGFTAFLGDQGGGGDSSIAVSNDTVVVMDQNHVGIFLRNGSLVVRSTPWDFDRPKLPDGQSISDPRVAFDVESGRFFSIGESAPLGGCIPDEPCANIWIVAVSKSSSPRSLTTSDWNFWGFDATRTEGAPSGFWGDFAFVQFDEENVIVTGQMIAHTSRGPISVYDRVWVFDKGAFLRGETIEGPTREFHDIPDPATGQVLINRFIPASHVGKADGVFLAHFGARDCDLVIGKVTGDARNASLSTRNVAIPGTCRGNRILGSQLGDPRGLNTQPHIVSSPVYTDGSLWIAQVVPASDTTPTVDALRLVRLNVTAWPAPPTVMEDSRLHAPGTSLDYPGLVVSPRGDVALVFNEFNASTFPTAAYAGRLAGEPTGSFHPIVPFAPGQGRHDYAGSGDPVLFGDFSTAVLDPSGDSAWLIAESTERTCVWAERVAHIEFSDGGRSDDVALPDPEGASAPCPGPSHGTLD